MSPLPTSNGMPCVCLAGGIPFAHFVIPTPLRCGKVLDPTHDETRSPSRLLSKHSIEKQCRYAGCLAQAVAEVIYSVVANRRHAQRTGENPPRGARAYSFVDCSSRSTIDHASFLRRSTPFLLLISTPPAFGRTLRFFGKLHRHFFIILSSSSFFVCGHNQSLYRWFPRYSLPNSSMSHTSNFLIPRSNTSRYHLYISHSPTLGVSISIVVAHGQVFFPTCSFS